MKSYRDAAKISAAKKMKGYASGGRVEEDISDEGSLPNVDGGPLSGDDGMSVDGGKAKSRLDRGGKKSPSTSVNIVVMSGKPNAPAPGAPPPMPVPSAPMAPPMPPPGAMPPMGGSPPPGLPMRKRGGRVNLDAGAGGGKGRLEKAKDYGSKAVKVKGK